MASSSYQQRVQRGMAAYFAAHPGATPGNKADDMAARQYARGHGSTGEHGVTVKPLGNNQYAVVFRDPAKADQALRAAAKLEGRVTVAAIGKDGKPINLFENKGHSKGFSSGEALEAAAKNAGGWSSFVARAMEKYEAFLADDDAAGDEEDDEEDDEVPGIREYQLIVQ